MTTKKYEVEKQSQDKNKIWPQYLSGFTALIAIFCSGLHLGWSSPSLPRLFSDEYPFNVTQEEVSYITVIPYAGCIVGNILSSLLVDLIGRKWTILLLALPQIVSMSLIYLSTYSVILLYTARLIGGMSEGACFAILPIYICEVTEPKIRGILGASFSSFLILGILFSNIVGSYSTIYDAASIYLVCSLIFVILFSFMPESPYYLIMKDRIEDAKAALMRLRGRKDVESEHSQLISDVRRQMSEKGTFKDLFTIPSNKMATIVMTILRILQQFSGIGSFSLYAQLLFQEATDAIPKHWAAILMISLQFVSNIVAILIVDVVGRKPLVLISIGGCALSLIFNGIFFTIRDFSDIDLSNLSMLPLTGLMLFIIFFALGLGSAVNLLSGELFPARVKAKALCMMSLIFCICMFASIKFYQYMADNYTLAIPFFGFALCQVVGFVYCCKYVPETMNKTLEEIQQELKRNRSNK